MCFLLFLNVFLWLFGGFRQEEWEQGGRCERLSARDCCLWGHSAFHVSVSFLNPLSMAVLDDLGAELTPVFLVFCSQGSVCYLRRGGPAEVGCCPEVRLDALLLDVGTGTMLAKTGEWDTVTLRTKYCCFVGVGICTTGFMTLKVVVSTRTSDEIFFVALVPLCCYLDVDSLDDSSQA